MKTKKTLFVIGKGVVIFIALLLMARVFVIVWTNSSFFQWDFKRYYFTARLSLAGYNPYDTKALLALFGNALPLKASFLYPPYTLVFFKPFSYFGLLDACHIFLAVKIIFFAGLIFLWKRNLFRESSMVYFLLFLSASVFSEGVYVDFYAGNISVMQQVLFWAGMVCFVKKRYFFSGVLLILASSFKLFLFIPYLALFLLTGAFAYFSVFLSLFVVLLIFVFSMNPSYFDLVRNNVLSVAFVEKGHIAASSKIFFEDLLSHASGNPLVAQYLYGVSVLFFGACFIYVLLKNRFLLKNPNFALVYFFILSFCLATPVLKDYEQIILMPAAYFLIDHAHRFKNYYLEIFLVIIYFVLNPHHLFKLQGLGVIGRLDFSHGILYFLTSYHIFLTVFVLWIVFVCLIFKEKDGILRVQRKEEGSGGC